MSQRYDSDDESSSDDEDDEDREYEAESKNDVIDVVVPVVPSEVDHDTFVKDIVPNSDRDQVAIDKRDAFVKALEDFKKEDYTTDICNDIRDGYAKDPAGIERDYGDLLLALTNATKVKKGTDGRFEKIRDSINKLSEQAQALRGEEILRCVEYEKIRALLATVTDNPEYAPTSGSIKRSYFEFEISQNKNNPTLLTYKQYGELSMFEVHNATVGEYDILPKITFIGATRHFPTHMFHIKEMDEGWSIYAVKAIGNAYQEAIIRMIDQQYMTWASLDKTFAMDEANKKCTGDINALKKSNKRDVSKAGAVARSEARKKSEILDGLNGFKVEGLDPSEKTEEVEDDEEDEEYEDAEEGEEDVPTNDGGVSVALIESNTNVQRMLASVVSQTSKRDLAYGIEKYTDEQAAKEINAGLLKRGARELGVIAMGLAILAFRGFYMAQQASQDAGTTNLQSSFGFNPPLFGASPSSLESSAWKVNGAGAGVRAGVRRRGQPGTGRVRHLVGATGQCA